MDKNSEIIWLNIITNNEFQSYSDLSLLKEISMVSKLTREKLNPLLFNNLELNLKYIKFELNVLNISHNNLYSNPKYDIKTLREESNCSIEDSLNDFVIALNDIKEYTKSFYYYSNCNSGYYLYSLISLFDNLTELKMYSCDVPFFMFADIGKNLPNLNKLELDHVDLIKSTADIITEKDINLPPNLSYLKFFHVCIITTYLLSDPLKYLLERKCENFVNFILPNISIPTLKYLDFWTYGEGTYEVEEFLDVNPNLESLLTCCYELDITDRLKSLKSLSIDQYICFDNIHQDFSLDSINNLEFSVDSDYYEITTKLCQICKLCPKLENLKLFYFDKMKYFQSTIDQHLAPVLSRLQHLKTLVIINENEHVDEVIDFSKFYQVEKLDIQFKKGSLLNIKFVNCKSLKQVLFKSFYNKIDEDFMRKFDQYNNWKFKFSEHNVRGYKI
jgi:hypothetical protein